MGDPDFSVGDPLLLELGYQSGDNQEFDVSSDDDVGIESLDYDPIHSVVYEKLHMRQSNRRIYGYLVFSLFSFIKRQSLIFFRAQMQIQDRFCCQRNNVLMTN